MKCGKPLRTDTEEYCPDCREHGSYLNCGLNLWMHREPVAGALYRFKYHNRRSFGKIFACELAEHYRSQISNWEIEQIIPIPLHRSRMRKRGFNQAEIIARELSDATGISVCTNALFRIRKTVPQKSLGRKKRQANLQGAFAVSKTWKPCRNALLIDDRYTTGATLNKAAKMLRMAGVQNVYFLTISIGQGI